jgi:hypothetical protein
MTSLTTSSGANNVFTKLAINSTWIRITVLPRSYPGPRASRASKWHCSDTRALYRTCRLSVISQVKNLAMTINTSRIDCTSCLLGSEGKHDRRRRIFLADGRTSMSTEVRLSGPVRLMTFWITLTRGDTDVALARIADVSLIVGADVPLIVGADAVMTGGAVEEG